VHWIDLLLLFEGAMLIVVLLRLAWPRRRAYTLFVGKQSSANNDVDQIDRAA